MDTPTGARKPGKRDPEGVRSDILAIATQEFAANGLTGARIDEIAARTRTSKRMIYYYFGDKEGLYRRVLEEAYRGIREGERSLDLGHLTPEAALRELVSFTFEHHRKNRAFIRLIMIENIHGGRYLERWGGLREVNRTAIETLGGIYRRGVAEGVFRDGLDPVKLHWMISAPCFYYVSNQATFSQIFNDDLWRTAGRERLKGDIAEMILGFVLKAV